MINDERYTSFRDDAGYVFWRDNSLYRSVFDSYSENYDLLNSSGLAKKLIDEKLLTPFEEVELEDSSNNIYKHLKPEEIPLITYPYEWTFSQYKDAALCTLEIQKTALDYGMTLKDASAFNIAYWRNSPILIDILSFEKYVEGDPWHSYGQFCRHFLGPLLILSNIDAGLTVLMKEYLDGIPLELIKKMIPVKAKLKSIFLMHIALQSSAKTLVTRKKINETQFKIPKEKTYTLITNLISDIEKLKPNYGQSKWANYYENTNYLQKSMNEKIKIVAQWTNSIKPTQVWDFGGNNGRFLRELDYSDGLLVCLDNDPVAIDDCYLKSKAQSNREIVPIFTNITNPSPGIGWNNKERKSLSERCSADLVLALALIHHLVIGDNIPLEFIRDFFAQTTSNLIIEFVPLEDTNCKKLQMMKKKDLSDYTQKNFEVKFEEKFIIKDFKKVENTKRILYLMQKK